MPKVNTVELLVEDRQGAIEGPIPRAAQIKEMVALFKPLPQCSRRQTWQQQDQETRTKCERHTPLPPKILRRKSGRDLMNLLPRFSTLIRGTRRSLRPH